jgi:hypothetical protein
MSDLLLTQSEADALLAIEKTRINNDHIKLPDLGGAIDIPLRSHDYREEFILSYTKHKINLAKRNHHLRGRKIIGIARLDLDGPPHRNPDGKEIGSRHLHLYREGYGLKWAFDIPKDKFINLDDAYQTLQDFFRYCNVIQLPSLARGLFT